MKTHLNLLPKQFSMRLLVRSRLLQWSFVWIATGVVVATVCLLEFDAAASQRGIAERLDHDAAPLRKIIQENEQIRKRLAELSERRALLRRLDGSQNPLRLIGLVSKAARLSGGRLMVDDFSLQQLQDDTSTPTAAIQQTKNGLSDHSDDRMTLILAGTAFDDLAIAQCIVFLRDTGLFDSVELKSSTKSQTADDGTREYLVECTF